MIYTDIKQAIGSTLLDIKTYKNEKCGDYRETYEWECFIFDTGIIVEESGVEYDGYVTYSITEANRFMPEELKELIKQYK